MSATGEWREVTDWRSVVNTDAVVTHVFQRLTGKDDIRRLGFTIKRFQRQRRGRKIVVNIYHDAVTTIAFRWHGVDVCFGSVAQVDNDAQGGFRAETGSNAVHGASTDGDTRSPAAAGIRDVKDDTRWSGEAELLEDSGAIKIKDELDFIRLAVVTHILQDNGKCAAAITEDEDSEQNQRNFSP